MFANKCKINFLKMSRLSKKCNYWFTQTVSQKFKVNILWIYNKIKFKYFSFVKYLVKYEKNNWRRDIKQYYLQTQNLSWTSKFISILKRRIKQNCITTLNSEIICHPSLDSFSKNMREELNDGLANTRMIRRGKNDRKRELVKLYRICEAFIKTFHEPNYSSCQHSFTRDSMSRRCISYRFHFRICLRS